MDLRDASAIKSVLVEARPDVVIHNAAAADVDFCEKEKFIAQEVNFYGTEILAAICNQFGIRIIFLSTDNVFSGEDGNYDEEAIANPINYYGETKRLAEEAVSNICENFVIARVALIYGMSITGGSSFSDWIFKNLVAGYTVPVYVDQFRTPIYSVSLAEALLELAELKWCGTIHLGGSQKLSRYEFARLFCDIFGFSKKYLKQTYMKNDLHLAKRPKDLSLNITRANKLLKSRLLNCTAGIELLKHIKPVA